MLNQIKQHTGLKINEIAQKLGVSKPTIHNWEKKNSWPLWALEACGMEVIPKEDAQDVCEWIVGKTLWKSKYWMSGCVYHFPFTRTLPKTCPHCGKPVKYKREG